MVPSVYRQKGFYLNFKSKLMKRKVRDSCGKARPGETPQAQRRRGRTARGKRVPGVEINVQICLQYKGTISSLVPFMMQISCFVKRLSPKTKKSVPQKGLLHSNSL
ncbi:hypothetical protein EI200_03720 [Peribacillus simplex]|nr:hypothetical protein EI200_03720 [Peribacillus simplex]